MDKIDKYLKESKGNAVEVESLVSDFHKSVEKMEADLKRKITSIISRTDDQDQLLKIASYVSEVSEPGQYVSWKKITTLIDKKLAKTGYRF